VSDQPIPGRVPSDVRAEEAAAAADDDELDGKTKDELLEIVQQREDDEGVDFGLTSSSTKAEILAALRG
jgi:hypothetical protein